MRCLISLRCHPGAVSARPSSGGARGVIHHIIADSGGKIHRGSGRVGRGQWSSRGGGGPGGGGGGGGGGEWGGGEWGGGGGGGGGGRWEEKAGDGERGGWSICGSSPLPPAHGPLPPPDSTTAHSRLAHCPLPTVRGCYNAADDGQLRDT